MSKSEYYKFLVQKTFEHYMKYGMSKKYYNKSGKFSISQDQYNTYVTFNRKPPYAHWDIENNINIDPMLCISTRGLAVKRTTKSEWEYVMQYDENIEKNILGKTFFKILNDIYQIDKE